MLTAPEITRLLFIDVETASGHPAFAEVPELEQKHWYRKAARLLRKDAAEELSAEEAAQSYTNSAAIFAEYGRVVCISCGYVRFEDNGTLPKYHIKSFYGTDEAALLQAFVELLRQNLGDLQYRWQTLCGHNIKEFDVPYLARRCVVNGILPLPFGLDIAGRKPWEIPHLDTMEQWKFGDYKAYTALELLASILDVPTPKADIDGSQVSGLFWESGELDRIAAYCERDVAATMSVLLRMNGLPIASPDAISYSVNP